MSQQRVKNIYYMGRMDYFAYNQRNKQTKKAKVI